jgi:hypothetical protein
VKEFAMIVHDKITPPPASHKNVLDAPDVFIAEIEAVPFDAVPFTRGDLWLPEEDSDAD